MGKAALLGAPSSPQRERAGRQYPPPEGATARTCGIPSQDTHTLPRPVVDKTFTNSVRGKKKTVVIYTAAL